VLLIQKDTAKDYKLVIEEIRDKGVNFATAEQAVFGFAHPLIGALVAKKWNFSADACQVILHYCDPSDGAPPDTPIEEKALVVQLADHLTHCAGIANPENYPAAIEKAEPLAKVLGLTDKTLEVLNEVVAETKKQFDNERHVYE
jgi:HD-like signal output (HDOD) protein